MEKTWREGLVPAFLAILIWAPWAFYANYRFGLGAGLIAAAVQAAGSFVTTMTLTAIVAFFYQRFSALPYKLSVPPVASIAIVATVLVAAHSLAGTPSVLATVLPPMTLGFLYCVYCVIKAHRAERAEQMLPAES